jgi:hypothetical protein
MGERFLDSVARALAEPMPRRNAVRVIGISLVSLAVPGLSPRMAQAAMPSPRARALAASPKRAGTCPPGGWKECQYNRQLCCPPDRLACCSEKSPASGQHGCCETEEHCCCGNTCCDPVQEACICPVPGGVGGACAPKVCGPDITSALDHVLSRVKSEFASWSAFKRAHACENLVTLPWGPTSWDIVELGTKQARERFARQYRPDCATCGFSVQVGSDCHYSGSVNYAVFGVMMRLCHDASTTFKNWFTFSEMLELIYMYKNVTGTQAANYEAASDWAAVGYSSKGLPKGDRLKCQLCSKPYKGRLTVRWTAAGNEYIR